MILRVKDMLGQWVNIPAIKGEKGDKGDKGETGPQGPQGEVGPQGPAGSAANITADNINKALGYTAANEADIPSLAGYATEVWVEGKGYLTQHQDISGKADASILNSHTKNTTAHITAAERTAWNAKANKSDIPTDEYINNLIEEKLGVIANGSY